LKAEEQEVLESNGDLALSSNSSTTTTTTTAATSPHDFFNNQKDRSFKTKRLLLASYLEYMRVDDDISAEQEQAYWQALKSCCLCQ
jgi:hypothetical protein